MLGIEKLENFSIKVKLCQIEEAEKERQITKREKERETYVNFFRSIVFTADTKMYRLVQVGAGWCRLVQASTA